MKPILILLTIGLTLGSVQARDKTATTSGAVTHVDGTRTANRSATGPNGQTKSETTTTTRNN